MPESELLDDPSSTNTFANACESLELRRGGGLLDDLKTVLLVSSEWHMRRVLLTVQTTFPQGLRFVCCPTLEGCARETWAAVKVCRAEVLQEWELLVAFRAAGLL